MECKSPRRFTFFYNGPSVADPEGIIVATENFGVGELKDRSYVYLTGWRIAFIRWLIEKLIPRPHNEALEAYKQMNR